MNPEHPEIQSELAETPKASTYEAPAIESVLTPDSLDREVHYAGIGAGSGPVAG